MQGRYQPDYAARREFLEMAKDLDFACFPILEIFAEFGIDQRTIRTHLPVTSGFTLFRMKI